MKCKLTFLLCLPFSMLLAQSSDPSIIAAQGGFSMGETMSVSWTIGDLVTETGVLNEGTLTQGFQQPTITVRELVADQARPTVLSDASNATIASRSEDEFNASVYPNPTGSDITVKVENLKQEYYLDLFDPAGNLLSRNRTSNPQEVINLIDLPPAQYVLRISLPESQQTKVFSIIKSN